MYQKVLCAATYIVAGPSDRAVAGIVGSYPAGGMQVCLLWVLCCQVEVSGSGWSLVQRSPTECGVPEYDSEASILRRFWRARGCCAIKKTLHYRFSLSTFTKIYLVSEMNLLMSRRPIDRTDCHGIQCYLDSWYRDRLSLPSTRRTVLYLYYFAWLAMKNLPLLYRVPPTSDRVLLPVGHKLCLMHV